MAITNQPAEISLHSAYSQIPVETDNLTSGLEIKTQNFSEPNMISLNILNNKQTEVLDNSAGDGAKLFQRIRNSPKNGSWGVVCFSGWFWHSEHSNNTDSCIVSRQCRRSRGGQGCYDRPSDWLFYDVESPSPDYRKCQTPQYGTNHIRWEGRSNSWSEGLLSQV